MNSQQLITILDSKYVENQFDSLPRDALRLLSKLSCVIILKVRTTVYFPFCASNGLSYQMQHFLSEDVLTLLCVSGRECNGPSTVGTEGRHGIGGSGIGTSEPVHDGSDMASVVLTYEIRPTWSSDDKLPGMVRRFSCTFMVCICTYGVIFTGISNLELTNQLRFLH